VLTKKTADDFDAEWGAPGNDTLFVKVLETDPVTERVKVQVLDASGNPTGEVIEGVRMVN
jgi:hypothetical protein